MESIFNKIMLWWKIKY